MNLAILRAISEKMPGDRDKLHQWSDFRKTKASGHVGDTMNIQGIHCIA